MALDDAQLVALRDALTERSEVRWAYLFGSAARGEPHRDVDVAVMLDRGVQLGFTEWGRLINALERRVGCDVDLVDLRNAPLPLLGSILADRIVLKDAERSARCDWEATNASLWVDFRPAYERFSATRLEALRERSERAG